MSHEYHIGYHKSNQQNLCVTYDNLMENEYLAKINK